MRHLGYEYGMFATSNKLARRTKTKSLELFNPAASMRHCQALGMTEGLSASGSIEPGVTVLRHCCIASQPALRANYLPNIAPLTPTPETWAKRLRFRGEVWTEPRIAEVVRRSLGDLSSFTNRSDSQTVSLERQKPVRRAQQRDEEAIKDGRKSSGRSLKKR